MKAQHQHRAAETRTRCFAGPVAFPENPAAHGNVVVISRCRCGAERRENVNGRHLERGPWRVKP